MFTAVIIRADRIVLLGFDRSLIDVITLEFNRSRNSYLHLWLVFAVRPNDQFLVKVSLSLKTHSYGQVAFLAWLDCAWESLCGNAATFHCGAQQLNRAPRKVNDLDMEFPGFVNLAPLERHVSFWMNY